MQKLLSKNIFLKKFDLWYFLKQKFIGVFHGFKNKFSIFLYKFKISENN